jgi:hypothetical protein
VQNIRRKQSYCPLRFWHHLGIVFEV